MHTNVAATTSGLLRVFRFDAVWIVLPYEIGGAACRWLLVPPVAIAGPSADQRRPPRSREDYRPRLAEPFRYVRSGLSPGNKKGGFPPFLLPRGSSHNRPTVDGQRRRSFGFLFADKPSACGMRTRSCPLDRRSSSVAGVRSQADACRLPHSRERPFYVDYDLAGSVSFLGPSHGIKLR